ncbi:MAG: DUF6982 domain-containing protein [Thermoanaerobaculales bacterium]
MDNRVVARFIDGRPIKGTTANFSPIRGKFHLNTPAGKVIEVPLSQLKAVFFVKSLEGNKAYREKKAFDGAKGFGRKVRCEFRDGEVLTGFTQSYDPTKLGFFITPIDPQSNNERIFVVIASTKRVTFEP